MSRGKGTWRLPSAAVVAALLACLTATPAHAAPTITIHGGPAGPTNESSPTFTFTVLDATLVECSIDQGTEAFGPCDAATSHTAGSLADGDWIFRIRATDAVPEMTIETRSFSVDTVAPTVSLTALGPAGPTKDPRPSFGWTTEADNVRECSVDRGTPDFGSCTSLDRHDQQQSLGDGAYTFRIRVTDPAGNTATATRDFEVDTAGPRAEVTGLKRTENRRPTFLVNSPEPGAVLTCKLDRRPRVRCGPTFTPGRKVKPGRHELVVTAFDALDNPGPPERFRFKVLRPALEAGRAEATVARALRRHKFANRVVANLEQRCDRRGRFRFWCRFSSAFPGYSLNGRGRVERQGGRISYRFRARAQGQTVVLTDENEGRFPG